MIPKSEWVYYGFPGHFVGGIDCAYHLSTRVGGYLISTVGAYFPGLDKEAVPVGTRENAFFETMIFKCDGEDKYGNPNKELKELYVEYYEKSVDAERGHRMLCRQIAKGIIP